MSSRCPRSFPLLPCPSTAPMDQCIHDAIPIVLQAKETVGVRRRTPHDEQGDILAPAECISGLNTFAGEMGITCDGESEVCAILLRDGGHTVAVWTVEGRRSSNLPGWQVTHLALSRSGRITATHQSTCVWAWRAGERRRRIHSSLSCRYYVYDESHMAV